MLCWVRLEFRCVEYSEVRVERRKLGELRPNEHVSHESHVPRVGRHIANRESIRRISSTVKILDEQLFALVQILADIGKQSFVFLGSVRLVDLAPVDIVRGGTLLDDELIVRRSARMRGCDGDERASRCKVTFAG